MSLLAGTQVEKVFAYLQEQLGLTRQSLIAASMTDRAETAGGFPQSTFANAPLLATGKVRSGDALFITDGRKPGEGSGAGTGVPAYYNQATDQWFRMSDDTAVVS
jgi:hypothetical protein